MTYTPATKPMPRPDVHAKVPCPGVPLSGHGHGRNFTPQQSPPVFSQAYSHTQHKHVHHQQPQSYTTYHHHLPSQNQTTHVYHRPQDDVAYVPNTCYTTKPRHYYPVPVNSYRPSVVVDFMSFAGFLAKCVLISGVALLLLAMLL